MISIIYLIISICIIVCIFGLQSFVFVAIPISISKNKSISREDKIRRYETLIRIPTFNDNIKSLLYYLIGRQYQIIQNFSQAIAYLQKALVCLPAPNLEADIRVHLGDSYASIGQYPQADAELQRAVQIAQTSVRDPLTSLALGNAMERSKRYEEACQAYLSGISLVKSGYDPLAVMLQSKLALAYFNNGQMENALQWALKVIELPKPNENKIIMHRIAGTICINLSDINNAEQHYNAALALSVTPQQKSDALAGLAWINRSRGNLEKSLELSQQAIAIEPEGNRIANINACETLKYMGRFEEARAVILKNNEAPQMFLAHLKTDSDAVTALSLAIIEGEIGDPKKAWDMVQPTVPIFNPQTKMRAYLQAQQAWIISLMGHTERAMQFAALAEKDVAAVTGSPGTQRDVYIYLTRAAIAVKQLPEAQRYLDTYVNLKPAPVDHPKMHYLQGEIYSGLNRSGDARVSYEAAIGTGIETYYTQLARKRLGDADDTPLSSM